jgi:hypothetical protein
VSADAEFSAYIARVRSLRDLAVETAKVAAPRVEAVVKATAAAGTSPSGVPWAPKKRGGGRALPNASGAVSAVAKGSILQIVLSGVYTYHQKSKGHPREIIPSNGGGIPSAIEKVLEETSRQVFARMTGAS